MKRTFCFEKPLGTIIWKTPSNEEINIPVFQGILKHLKNEDLQKLLNNYYTIRKYTQEAIKKASWPLLRQFPGSWIRTCMKDLSIPPARREAIEFLLSASD
jgi:hypothetical protein